MSYCEHLPAPALRRHVACYWTLTSADPTVAAHRVLPDGCMDMLFRVERSGDVTPLVVGVMTRAVIAPAAEAAGYVGVRFLPGEAFAFLDVSADATRDRHLTPDDAGLPDLRALAAQLADAPRRRLADLDAFLLARRHRARFADPRVRHAVARLLAAPGSCRVADVSAAVGLSERHLERAFRERVGLSPKLLARVLRLQALVPHLSPRPLSWSALAAELGYADQAHLIREVRALAGVTPTVLLRERMSDSFNPKEARPARNGA